VIENAVLLDSSVAVYAFGGESELRPASQRVLSLAAEHRGFRAYASVEMIQEFVHHRLRRTGDRALAAEDGRNVAALCTVLTFDREVLDLSLDLVARIPTVRGRDAVHAATALAYGIERIVTTDRAFDGIPGLIRVDPREFAA